MHNSCFIHMQACLAIGLDPSGANNIEDEWCFFITQEEPLYLKQLAATNKSYAKLFPALCTVAIRVLLLLVSTAVVECLFLSMNRVMTVDRTKLTNDHPGMTRCSFLLKDQPFQIHERKLHQSTTIMLLTM